MSGIVGVDRAAAAGITYRDLSTLDDYAAVVALEREIWGPDYDEAVPVAILKVTVTRGAILVGAFDDDDRLIGFVYSLRGTRNGKPTQWSHKLGVANRFRNAGVGYRLKLLQRERAIEMGLDLIEWTFDPMQATNAHLNFAKLGVVVDEYEEDFYGNSTVPVRYRGNPTDRFIAAWNIRDPRVARRVAASAVTQGGGRASTLGAHDVADVTAVNHAVPRGDWRECVGAELDVVARRLSVEVPTGFSEMQSQAPELALAWRLATRQIFATYFSRGYRAIEFDLDRVNRKGTYLLVKA